jgi:hypothetical protein
MQTIQVKQIQFVEGRGTIFIVPRSQFTENIQIGDSVQLQTENNVRTPITVKDIEKFPSFGDIGLVPTQKISVDIVKNDVVDHLVCAECKKKIEYNQLYFEVVTTDRFYGGDIRDYMDEQNICLDCLALVVTHYSSRCEEEATINIEKKRLYKTK